MWGFWAFCPGEKKQSLSVSPRKLSDNPGKLSAPSPGSLGDPLVSWGIICTHHRFIAIIVSRLRVRGAQTCAPQTSTFASLLHILRRNLYEDRVSLTWYVLANFLHLFPVKEAMFLKSSLLQWSGKIMKTYPVVCLMDPAQKVSYWRRDRSQIHVNGTMNSVQNVCRILFGDESEEQSDIPTCLFVKRKARRSDVLSFCCAPIGILFLNDPDFFHM